MLVFRGFFPLFEDFSHIKCCLSIYIAFSCHISISMIFSIYIFASLRTHNPNNLVGDQSCSAFLTWSHIFIIWYYLIITLVIWSVNFEYPVLHRNGPLKSEEVMSSSLGREFRWAMMRNKWFSFDYLEETLFSYTNFHRLWASTDSQHLHC